MALICVLIFLIFAVAFLVPLFIVLKLDGTVTWNWGVVFIPLWIINAVPFFYSTCLPCFVEKKAKALISLFQYFALLIFQILLCIQLQTYKWNWAIVFIPIYYHELVHILRAIPSVTPSKFTEAQEQHSEGVLFGLGYAGFVLKNFVIKALRVWFIIFLVIKLTGTVHWSWWINAIPIFVAMAWFMVVRGLEFQRSLGTALDEEDRARRKSMMNVVVTVISILLTLGLVFTILSVESLDGSSYHKSITFIPIWIVFGFLTLCCCCCVPIACCCMKGREMDGGQEDPESGANDSPTETSRLTPTSESAPSSPPTFEGSYQNQNVNTSEGKAEEPVQSSAASNVTDMD